MELAFEKLELDWRQHVEFNQRLVRPAEVDILQGDASKARQVLGWQPKVNFKELVTS